MRRCPASSFPDIILGSLCREKNTGTIWRLVQMAKRMIIMLLAVVSFVGALGFVKYQKIQTSIKQASSFAPPPEAVTTIMAREETWQGSLGAIGTVTAVNGVVISADLPGVVQKITFKSGDRVAPGDLLVQLDTRQEGSPDSGDQRPGGLRHGRGGAEAGGGERRRDPRHDRAQDGPRALRRDPRHPPGQSRTVSEKRRPGRAASVARSDLRQLRHAAAGAGPDAGRRSGERDGRGDPE